jgi:hypothetical protein
METALIKKLVKKSKTEESAAKMNLNEAERWGKKVKAIEEKMKNLQDDLEAAKGMMNLAFMAFRDMENVALNSRRQAQREFEKTLSHDLDLIERCEAWVSFLDNNGL